MRSRSIRCGVFPRESPSRSDSRATWVSTTTPSLMPKQLPRTTFAVLRATPRRRRSSSIVRGTSPPKRPMRRRQVSCTAFAFERNRPIERMCGSISAGVARA
jgi:hypothetical protein